MIHPGQVQPVVADEHVYETARGAAKANHKSQAKKIHHTLLFQRLSDPTTERVS